VIVLALPIFFHLTRYVGARSDNERKNEPYESGVGGLTHTESFDTFNIKFYVVGIVFFAF